MLHILITFNDKNYYYLNNIIKEIKDNIFFEDYKISFLDCRKDTSKEIIKENVIVNPDSYFGKREFLFNMEENENDYVWFLDADCEIFSKLEIIDLEIIDTEVDLLCFKDVFTLNNLIIRIQKLKYLMLFFNFEDTEKKCNIIVDYIFANIIYFIFNDDGKVETRDNLLSRKINTIFNVYKKEEILEDIKYFKNILITPLRLINSADDKSRKQKNYIINCFSLFVLNILLYYCDKSLLDFFNFLLTSFCFEEENFQYMIDYIYNIKRYILFKEGEEDDFIKTIIIKNSINNILDIIAHIYFILKERFGCFLSYYEILTSDKERFKILETNYEIKDNKVVETNKFLARKEED